MQEMIDWIYKKYYSNPHRPPGTFSKLVYIGCLKFNIDEEEFYNEILSRL